MRQIVAIDREKVNLKSWELVKHRLVKGHVELTWYYLKDRDTTSLLRVVLERPL